MSEDLWIFILPLLVLNGVSTLLAWKSRYHSGRARRRLMAMIWLLPVVGAVLAVIATSRRKPPAARWSVARAKAVHYDNGAAVAWGSAVAYRYERDERGDGGDETSAGGGFADAGSGGGDGGCGGDGGHCG